MMLPIAIILLPDFQGYFCSNSKFLSLPRSILNMFFLRNPVISESQKPTKTQSRPEKYFEPGEAG